MEGEKAVASTEAPADEEKPRDSVTLLDRAISIAWQLVSAEAHPPDPSDVLGLARKAPSPEEQVRRVGRLARMLLEEAKGTTRSE